MNRKISFKTALKSAINGRKVIPIGVFKGNPYFTMLDSEFIFVGFKDEVYKGLSDICVLNMLNLYREHKWQIVE